MEYAQSSGSIFVDCSIHDIDLALWFFGNYCVERQCGGIAAVSPRRGNTMTGITRWASWNFGGKIALLQQDEYGSVVCTRSEGLLEIANEHCFGMA